MEGAAHVAGAGHLAQQGVSDRLRHCRLGGHGGRRQGDRRADVAVLERDARGGGFHPLDLVGARPKGPARLTPDAAAAAEARLAKAFGANVPHHQRTLRMGHLYRVKDGEVAYMDAFFGAVLAAMHPATEHLLWLEVTSLGFVAWSGERVQVAVFLGSNEKVKFAFDLRRLKSLWNFTAFTARASDTLLLFVKLGNRANALQPIRPVPEELIAPEIGGIGHVHGHVPHPVHDEAVERPTPASHLDP